MPKPRHDFAAESSRKCPPPLQSLVPTRPEKRYLQFLPSVSANYCLVLRCTKGNEHENTPIVGGFHAQCASGISLV